MSTTSLGPLHNVLPVDPYSIGSLKRKAEMFGNMQQDMVLNVKRPRTTTSCAVEAAQGSFSFVQPTLLSHMISPFSLATGLGLKTPGDVGSLVPCDVLSVSTGHHVNLTNVASGIAAIAAIAASELSLLPKTEFSLDRVMKLPPPPTISPPRVVKKVESPVEIIKETEDSKALDSDSRTHSSDGDDEIVDLSSLDLDLDPESDEVEEDEMWASKLLFCIKQAQANYTKLHAPASRITPATESAAVLHSETIKQASTASFEAKSESKRSKKMKRRRGHFPKTTTDLLKKWLFDHLDHPYPTEEEKAMLADDTGLTIKQINYWFTNSRRRFLKKASE